jgi:acyl-[acyl carrier protein]--UDP-N-acetylglucosamine O-acyltransferase
LEDNTIQPFVVIGNNVVLWSGNHIGHHSEIGDHVFLTSHVVISGHVRIEPYSFFGVNATIRDGLVIAEGTLVGMGATVVKNTEPYGVYSSEGAKKRPDLRSDQMPGF